MAQAPPQYTYTPPPNELPYYNALFTTADANSSGYLSGPDAVSFLSLSKLPVDLLKQIWTMADQPASNTLDAGKFHVAVRLIQLFQNGKKPVDLALNLGEGDGEGVRPPFFEGVNVQAAMQQQQAQMGQQMGQQNVQPPQPSPPMQPTQPPQPQLSASPQRSPQLNAMSSIPPTMNGGAPPTIMAAGAPLSSSTALAVQDPYSMTPQEFSRYEQIFPSYAQADPNDGKMYVGGGAAVELFSKSGTYDSRLWFGSCICFFFSVYFWCVCVEALKEEMKSRPCVVGANSVAVGTIHLDQIYPEMSQLCHWQREMDFVWIC